MAAEHIEVPQTEPSPLEAEPPSTAPQAEVEADGGASGVNLRRRKQWTTSPAEGVDLLIGEAGMEAEAPTTVGRMFKDTAERLPDHPAHMYKENDEWKAITYKQYYDRCITAAKSFLKVRVHKMHA